MTPTEDTADATMPSSDAEGNVTTPSQSDQNEQYEEKTGSDNIVLIIVVSAVVILGGAGAAAFVCIRKKRFP